MKSETANGLAVDAVKGSPVAVYLATILAGIDWGAMAAAMAALYSAILIGEKLWKLVIQPLWLKFRPKPAT